MAVASAAEVASGGLLGRDDERDVIDRLLSEAREGSSATLVLRGEAGIGKTALLDYARSHAGDALVLRCRGVEWETELPFSGLGELLRPLLGSLSELPEPQRAALASVLALAPPVAGER